MYCALFCFILVLCFCICFILVLCFPFLLGEWVGIRSNIREFNMDASYHQMCLICKVNKSLGDRVDLEVLNYNNLRHADDTVSIADSEGKLQ